MKIPYDVSVPTDWVDITELEDDPWTLAKEDGVGALQFSGTVYRSGKKPDPSTDELLEMLHAHLARHGLVTAENLILENEPTKLASASFRSDGKFFRAWYVTDGLSITCITYNCSEGNEGLELAECEEIVRSLKVIYEPRT